MTATHGTEAAPRPEIILRPRSYVESLDVAGMFARPAPLEVELGSGDGGFLSQWAQLHPERNFLGIERLLGRLRKLERKGRRAALQNLRLLRIEAAYFLEYLLPAETVTAFHVYFPDPWPKRKHRSKRLVNPAFTSLCARVLLPSGTVYLRTDDLDYFQQMLSSFGSDARFVPVETESALRTVVTDFERGFHQRGVSTNHAAFRRLGVDGLAVGDAR